MGSVPSDAEIRREMEKIVPKVDLDKITTKQFIKLLGAKMGGVDFSKKKKFIKKNLTEVIASLEKEESDEDETEEEDESESEEDEPPKKKKKAGSGGGGLAAVKQISPRLAKFLGKGDKMARTQIVKGLWEYIRENNLQNPEDGREIILDKRMRKVFGADRFTMFQMNKYISAHIHPFPPLDLSKKEDRATKKRKIASKTKKSKVPRKQGQQPPYRLSRELAEIVGVDILPRPQVTQGLWAYIRKHNLQNPENKREIICDKRFRYIMGGEERVTMFSMNKYISKHMIEKLDKTEYIHNHDEKKEEKEEEVEVKAEVEVEVKSEEEESEEEESESEESDEEESETDSDDE
mmetsp:Transcript_20648/g.30359  ORF Transcript_20648/g.30359 Transcript_20648/m.30359 type:complete len:349 (-) Transcript_20648:492-1538(-)